MVTWLVLPKGVRYIDLEPGSGTPCKKGGFSFFSFYWVGDVIHIHHKGRILNTGKAIPENSYDIGVPLSLRIGVG